jgi:hypothetical protein
VLIEKKILEYFLEDYHCLPIPQENSYVKRRIKNGQFNLQSCLKIVESAFSTLVTLSCADGIISI